jgi:hypothetical protein
LAWPVFFMKEFLLTCHKIWHDPLVPDKRSRILEVVVVRRLLTWVLGIWSGEGWEGLRKGSSVYEQPGTKVDGSCHSQEGFQVSKGDKEREQKGFSKGSKKQRDCAIYIL